MKDIEKLNKEIKEDNALLDSMADTANSYFEEMEDEKAERTVSRMQVMAEDINESILDRRIVEILSSEFSGDPVGLMKYYCSDPTVTGVRIVVHRATKTNPASVEIGDKVIRVPILRVAATAKKENISFGAGDWRTASDKAALLATAYVAGGVRGLDAQQDVLRSYGASRKAFGLPMGNIPVTREECYSVFQTTAKFFVGDIEIPRENLFAIAEGMTRKGRIRTIKAVSKTEFIDLVVDAIGCTLSKTNFQLVYRKSKTGSVVECCLSAPASPAPAATETNNN